MFTIHFHIGAMSDGRINNTQTDRSDPTDRSDGEGPNARASFALEGYSSPERRDAFLRRFGQRFAFDLERRLVQPPPHPG